MASDTVYDICLPILTDATVDEDDKAEKLEEILRKETSLAGRSLEDAILSVLWRFRNSSTSTSSSPPIRHTVIRRASPASWQIPRASTPMASPGITGASPAPPPGFGIARPTFPRAKPSVASPFTSPRPSPRLALASPIPHSPNLNSYEFSEPSTELNDYGEYGSDTVDWLVNDESASRPSSSGAGSGYESGLSGAAAAWVQPQQQTEMSPHDMLRSVLGDGRSDEEIEGALEANGYDLSATLMALMENQSFGQQVQTTAPEQDGRVLIGKSMTPSQPISIDQPETTRSSIVCRYWLSTGSCLRADCRFSHDLSSHICKYWVMGNCLAGTTCIFSHDPANLMNNLTLDNGNTVIGTPPTQTVRPSFQVQDYDAFPTLQPAGMDQWETAPSYAGQLPSYNSSGSHGSRSYMASSPGASAEFKKGPSGAANVPSSPRSYGSRPTSRHQSREPTPVIPSVDDTEAFPSLGSASAKGMKKHHGKRGGHGHGHNKENTPNSLADIVRMSPSPAPGLLRKGLMKSRSYTGSRENSLAAQAIPPPQHIPWLETGEKANQAYIKARQDAFKHGGLRNKFLQSAAQAWNRNDARAAKALSLRGQSENDLMRKAHREAARLLYEERNKESASVGELYIDLHGLHPEEAVEYLERVLLEQSSSKRAVNGAVYAITGTGHHSKNGKDKVGKSVRSFLGEWKYAFREFSVPGDRGNIGGILGIDPMSFDRSLLGVEKGETETEKDNVEDMGGEDKARVVKEAPTGPRGKLG